MSEEGKKDVGSPPVQNGDNASPSQNVKDKNRSKTKRKFPKGIGAPKQPLSGYLQFATERREKVREEQPNLTFSELTRLIAAEWGQLSAEEKSGYIRAAEADRQRYNRELKEYQQTEAYKQFLEQQQEISQGKKKKSSENVEKVSEKNSDENTFIGAEIPIFSEEFLNYNKKREGELRQLRKQVVEYEEQSTILQKHIDHMKAAGEKLEADTVVQRNNNASLQQYLDTLRQVLMQKFSNVPLPGTNEVPTLNTVDHYMAKLHSIVVESGANENQQFISKVRDLVQHINYSSLTAE